VKGGKDEGGKMSREGIKDVNGRRAEIKDDEG
jgi:hypothetical protein